MSSFLRYSNFNIRIPFKETPKELLDFFCKHTIKGTIDKRFNKPKYMYLSTLTFNSHFFISDVHSVYKRYLYVLSVEDLQEFKDLNELFNLDIKEYLLSKDT